MLKQNDQILYDNGIMKGVGEVVGVALTEQPIIGKTWIVRDLSGNIPNETYEFDTFVLFDCHIFKD